MKWMSENGLCVGFVGREEKPKAEPKVVDCDVESMSFTELRTFVAENNIECEDKRSKQSLVDAIKAFKA